MKLNKLNFLIILLWFLIASFLFADINQDYIEKNLDSIVIIKAYSENSENLYSIGYIIDNNSIIILKTYLSETIEIIDLNNNKYTPYKVKSETDNFILISIKGSFVNHSKIIISKSLPEPGSKVYIINVLSDMIYDIIEANVESINEFEFGTRAIFIDNSMTKGVMLAGIPLVNNLGEVVGINKIPFFIPTKELLKLISKVSSSNHILYNSWYKQYKLNLNSYLQKISMISKKRLEIERLLDQSKFEEALSIALENVEDSSNLYDSYLLARCYANVGNIIEAVKIYNGIIKQKPDYVWAYIRLGHIYYLIYKDYRKAIEYYQRCIAINPYFAHSYFWIAKGYYELGNVDKAINWCISGLKLNPDSIMGHINLGYYYNKKGNYRKAINEFKFVIQLAPDNIYAYCYLGWTYADSGEYDKAIHIFKYIITNLDSNYYESYNGLGWCYYDLKDYDNAIKNFKKAVELNPNYSFSHKGLGMIYADLNYLSKALEQYKILKNIDKEIANELFEYIY